ncbi:hypothetical protein ACIRG5_26145 [Lentzea sp. NPDC102401]|uniref:hypothetical protein n=1 Tax=Lentzea sp. NPDC102401 TaxID=3364128 RepID=UPI00381240CF
MGYGTAGDDHDDLEVVGGILAAVFSMMVVGAVLISVVGPIVKSSTKDGVWERVQIQADCAWSQEGGEWHDCQRDAVPNREVAYLIRITLRGSPLSEWDKVKETNAGLILPEGCRAQIEDRGGPGGLRFMHEAAREVELQIEALQFSSEMFALGPDKSQYPAEFRIVCHPDLIMVTSFRFIVRAE